MGGYLSHLEAEQSSEVRNASCGPVIGNCYQVDDGQVVDGYLGIPYAKPPIGSLRFKNPVPMDKWAEPLGCHKYGPWCPQNGSMASFVPQGITTSEDNCLTLNVFAPREKSEKTSEFSTGFPVIVYFHGGGHEVGGSGMIHDCSLANALVKKGVVVVTVNFRLGPLGFLTTGDDVAKGNYGLWDQTLALRWVQDHIASFHGDKSNVTICGSSAGAASCDLLALSPHSNSLFHRFIAMSGAAYCDYAVRNKQTQSHVFLDFAKFHGYTGGSSEELLRWYQEVPVEKFKEVAGWQSPASGFLTIAPNLDGDFFPSSFEDLREKAPKLDAIFFIGEYEGLSMSWHNPMFNDPKGNFKQLIAQYYGPDVTDQFLEAQETLYEAYTNGLEPNDMAGYTKRAVEFLGDVIFNHGVLESAQSLARRGNRTYLASFDYYCKEAEDPFAAEYPFRASSHCSDFQYVFGTNLMGAFKPTEEELKVMDQMGNYVADFAKYGNPNGKSKSDNGPWLQYSYSQPDKYFKIDYPRSEMSDKFQSGRLEIHKKIDEKSKKYQGIINGKHI